MELILEKLLAIILILLNISFVYPYDYEIVNEKKYISIEQLAKNILKSNEFELSKENLKTNEYQLIFAEGSFFIVYEDEDNFIITQMQSTAIRKDNNILFPISVIDALKESGVINLFNRNKDRTIKTAHAKKTLPIIHWHQKPKHKVLTGGFAQSDTMNTIEFDTTIPPNIYRIPKDLKIKTEKFD